MYQPVVPAGGIVGFRYLERTLERQQDAFAAAAGPQRALDHFREKIGSITSAEELVADRQLREVALAAFGLEADIDSIFFVRKMLEEGTRDPDALANKVADRRYREFSAAFGFDEPFGPNTQVPGFADRIAARFTERSFEAAVGDVDPSLRIALNARREMSAIADGTGSENSKWFTVMGTPPLRKLVEGALGLPQGIGALDLDRQLTEFKSRAQATFGTSDVSGLAEEGTISRMIDLYLAREQANGGGFGFGGGPTSPALQILRGF